VLVDLAPGGGRLEPGHPITADELDAACRVDVEPGDIVLVRTGNGGLQRERKRAEYATADQPGLTTSCCRWLKEHDVAAVATDTIALEVYPGEDPAALFPVHLLNLVDIGLWQGQNFDLEDLAAACAADDRYTFLLEASPIPFTGAVGAPVNPVAIR
jgi:kynurenine formamidase